MNGRLIECRCSCIRCLLECIGDIIRFINRYAFTICSIYGDDYCEGVRAADPNDSACLHPLRDSITDLPPQVKITMDVLQQNGFEAIINDDLGASDIVVG